jgi:hypothetical protein
MIDPIHALAFSITSTPGAYALLLGSGISRSAGIPTGWEITIELVKKLALLKGEDPIDAERWYVEVFGKTPDYAELLDHVSRTPSERQQLLREYWEPTELERDQALKQPTAAHRSIAQLIASKVIRVVVTTNFDRLLETALHDAGVIPTVISTVDQIKGAMPLIHCQCCIIKVHGDYLDTRIRNTPAELAEYEPELNTLLDRVFDEFGIIVCGWSAEWDVALRAAITRAPSRRFGTYWTSRGELGEKAAGLLAHRSGATIPIIGADQFFEDLNASVQALKEFSRPHPVSKEMAIANMKKYLTSPNLGLRLEELVLGEAEKARDRIDAFAFSLWSNMQPDAETYMKRVDAYHLAVEPLAEMAALGLYWSKPEHYSIWRRALEIVHKPVESNGTTYKAWAGAAHIPGIIVFYALGLSAVASNNLIFLAELFSTETRNNNRDLTMVEQLAPMSVFDEDHGPAQFLLPFQNRILAMNLWLRENLRILFKRIYPQEKGYHYAFVKFELLIALAFAWRQKRTAGNFWVPPGLWCSDRENREKVFSEIAVSLAERETSSFAHNLIGENWADASERLVIFREHAPQRFPRLYD